MMAINFDMDGTLANFYGVDGWLDSLKNNSVRPYTEARPLLNMNSLARLLNRLHREGYEINIISWTAKNGSAIFNEAIAEAKREWLNKHLHSVHFDHIYIIPYGEPKQNYGQGILFDDEIQNRENWNGLAFDVDKILEILKNL